MTSMKLTLTFAVTAVLLVVGPALADWFPGEPYKMHYPQLPDPFGWDVNATYPKVLADDWQCTETGPVSDIHVWGSWQNDVRSPILNVHASIHKNIPADPLVPYSRPGGLLWERDFDPTQFKVLDPYGTGDEGWYDPNTGEYHLSDHQTYHQINIENIDAPFTQLVGEIYWLDISVTVEDPAFRWGWKTSQDHFMDDAVWTDAGLNEWTPLIDPITGESLDMAFVITPEPTSLCLLALGGLAALRRRR
jgi:hypothetical protein